MNSALDTVTQDDVERQLARHLTCDADILADAIAHLDDVGALAIPMLNPEGCDILAGAADALAFRPATPVMGKGDKRVYQEFDICMDVPADNAYARFARVFDGLCDAALARLDSPPLEQPFTINDLAVQIYKPGAIGITPHLDHTRYVGLIALIVVCGEARYFLCDDRAGTGEREVPAPPGHCVLMVAPGFAGRRDRPFHTVRNITTRRISFGLRRDSRPDGAAPY